MNRAAQIIGSATAPVVAVEPSLNMLLGGLAMSIHAFRPAARTLTVTLLLVAMFGSTGCGFVAARELQGDSVQVPADFSFVGDKSPCFLELNIGAEALRMNCFHIAGRLHIHSSRWAKLPRWSGESWTVTIRRQPRVRIEIAGKIYSMQAAPIEDENYRQELLHNRGYWHAWDAITVFQFSECILIGSESEV